MNKDYIYLSEIKWKVLQYINNFTQEKKFSPTYKEIAESHNFSRARAGAICGELFKLGLISKGKSAHRKIRLSRKQINLIPTLHFNKEYPTMKALNG
nr:LexA family transcriptional repressor [uncultured Mediterranean phage uvMED]